MSTTPLYRGRTKEQALAWGNRQKHLALSAEQASALDIVYPDWRKTLNGVWFTRLEAVEALVAVNGFFPRAAAKDPAEKQLGIWMAAQRYRVELLSPDRIKLLNERLPGWNKSKDEAWNERLEEICAIVAELGRIPHSTEKETEARRAGVWLKRFAKAPETDPKVITLNERIPGWNDRSNDAVWARNMDALEAFVNTHGRFPTQHEKSRDDRRLGVWLHTRRQAGEGLSDQRRDELTRRVPGWDRSADDKWNDCLDAAVAYFTQHGRLPSDHSSDPKVAASGRWVWTQRTGIDSMPEHRVAALDSRLPGWRARRDDKWESMLEYVEAFVKEKGRFPARSGDIIESRGAMWLGRQKKGLGVTLERAARLDAGIPGWRETAEDVWNRKLAEFEAFYQANGRRAWVNAPDSTERALGVWFNNTKNGPLSAERSAALDAADIGVLRSPDEIWSDTLEAVIAFRAAHGRFPTGSGKVSGERQLATWLTNQRGSKAKMSTDRRELMAARLPRWDVTLEDIWRTRLQECVDFVCDHGRLPSLRKGVTEDELKIGQWLCDQRKAKNMVKPRRVAILDARLDGWRG